MSLHKNESLRKNEELKPILNSNWELRRLVDRREKIERRLRSLYALSFRTAAEQIEERKLKKNRLAAKERIMQILAAVQQEKEQQVSVE